jgi:hypothetical protein
MCIPSYVCSTQHALIRRTISPECRRWHAQLSSHLQCRSLLFKLLPLCSRLRRSGLLHQGAPHVHQRCQRIAATLVLGRGLHRLLQLLTRTI